MAKKSFEEDLKRLEEIVEIMERGDATLNDSMKLFEEGVKLSRLCGAALDKAELKVETLSRQKDGTLLTEPFPKDY